ncbi:endonuclease/exonuclease/phosphatase family [Rubidibacter lacunae KORDI 51-2]|uniref:Endonuclease/exonuclease/phosphatase family n=2 Tax=Rubidibacter TaxID=582491 RepID=U5DIV9_9CHRO|nr:endonuclease/exonuclease/phosphatase family [Rubidibacter lacunae KORDI 51-2]
MVNMLKKTLTSVCLGLSLFVGLVFINITPALAQTNQEAINVLFWNVESGGSDSAVIEDEIADLEDQEGPFDLIGLTEVREADATGYVLAFGSNYTGITSESGGGDRMVIVFNRDRFALKQTTELVEHKGVALNFINRGGNLRFRSPFVATLNDRLTGRNLLLMVNHLARNNGSNSQGGFRAQQAEGLVAWAEDQALPIIMGGDLNLDFNLDSGEGNESFQILFGEDDSDNEEYRWIRPQPLVQTNFSNNRFPDSILDFVTVASQSENFQVIESRVIVRPGDFPDDSRTSDHRPVFAVLKP